MSPLEYSFVFSQKMISSTCGKELLSSIASLSPPFSLKSGTLEPSHLSDPINPEISPTPELTIPEIQSSSSTHTSTVHIQTISSTLKTRHSPTPPPENIQLTFVNVTYTVHSKNKSGTARVGAICKAQKYQKDFKMSKLW